MSDLKFKKGAIILFSEGEYSDYGLNSIVKTLRAIDLVEVNYAYIIEGHGDSIDEFVPWLIRKKMVEPVDHNNIHLGCYGRLRLN